MADSAQPAVRVRGLAKRYGDTVALDGVDLEVRPGELRGLLGLNGAGKTTLLRTLFGLIRPDAGSIELLGGGRRDRGAGPLDGVAGFVEEPAFYPYLSGRANLELLTGLDDTAVPDLDGALERVGLAARARDRVSGYSTGMRQRLGIAAALLREPQLLLLDEPTSGLDPPGTQAVTVLLRELSARGVAVILSSHLIGELEAVCDSYTIIRDGRVVWDGDAARLETEAPGSVYGLSTTDDVRALEIGRPRPGIDVDRMAGVPGLRLIVEPSELDGYMRALAREEITVRRLELLVSPLKTLFFSVTSDSGLGDPASGLERARRLAEAAGLR
jgi:ABC-2 type transport system ATP-binding protein